LINYDPYSDSFHEDPYPVYRELRDTAPVYHHPEQGFWAISRYEDVAAALMRPQVFSSKRFLGPPPPSDPSSLMPIMVVLDPPRHDELRSLVNRAFTPQRIAALEPHIRDITTDLVDSFIDSGRCDLFRDLAAPLPTIVIAELLGVPTEDREMFKEKSIAIAASVGPAGVKNTDASFELAAYLSEVFTEKRKHPGDDLMSALLTTEINGRALSQEELMGFALLLLVAGNETTTNLISNATILLDRFPDQRARLLEDRSLIGSAVEEFLRFESPVQGVERLLTEDVVIQGQTIHRGEKVFLLLGAANRDEREIEDPDRFDVGRDPNPHLAFGFGAHFCLGASLARLELRVVWEEILARFPKFQVVQPVERLHSATFRGMLSVPLELDT